MPETKFIGARPQILPPGQLDEKADAIPRGDHTKSECSQVERTSDDLSTAQAPEISKKSYWKSLVFCSQIDHSVNLRKTFLRPFVLMTYPTVLWSSLVYGMSLGWNVILGASVAQLFAPP